MIITDITCVFFNQLAHICDKQNRADDIFHDFTLFGLLSFTATRQPVPLLVGI